ncbi:MAG: tetratricopeptide repeat protein [Pseudomonadota bacterium]
MPRSALTKFALCFSALLFLAACESSEERAEGHFQSALELIEAGDVERAIVEFRNVFKLDGSHREARKAYAALLRGEGQVQQSYGQYLRLVEQYPNDFDGRLALSQMAVELQNWPEVRRHSERAIELQPDNSAVQAVELNLTYADALEAEDASARRDLARQAQSLVEQLPENLGLRRLLVDSALRDQDLSLALTEIDRTLEIDPENRELYNTRLGILAQLDRTDDVETLLIDMVDRFEGDQQIVATLLRFYVSRGELDKAEGFLREVVAKAEPGATKTDAQMALVRFLSETRSMSVGLDELDQIIAQSDSPEIFRAVRASTRFELGETEAGISEMQEILDGAEATDETRSIKIALSQMLTQTGNLVGAQRLVSEVLEEDATQVEALKMQAGWLIEADKADDAIAMLRTALDQSPNDAAAMTLMAQAHTRNGSRELARDMLSLAVDASNNAPEESIRYASALLRDERFQLAEDVLLDSLRLNPGNLRLLTEIGKTYVAMEDWARTEQVETTMRNLDTAVALRAADGLQATRLAAQGRTEDAIAFLEGLAQDGENGDTAAQITVVRARLANGEQEAALRYAEEALSAQPNDLSLQFTLATAQAANGLFIPAEATYRGILDDNPLIERAWTELIRTLYAQGNIEGAEEALNQGLEALPGALNLLWAEASFKERSKDFDAAIEIYEQLYERASNSPVVANNLASLLSTHRTDEESLKRAYAVARRLRSTEFAPFQDTYGWIAYRRGDYEEAIAYLEPAAAELSGDALVQYHLAMTYIALERLSEGLGQLDRALVVAGPDDERTQFDTARAEKARLEGLGITPITPNLRAAGEAEELLQE